MLENKIKQDNKKSFIATITTTTTTKEEEKYTIWLVKYQQK